MKVGTDGVLLGAAMTLLPSDRTLLDVGTGTGVIALLAACRLAEYNGRAGLGDRHIDAIDIDPESVAEAAQNFSESAWSEQLSAHCESLQKFAPQQPLECIFSNPPYYDSSLLNPDRRECAARHTITLSYRDLCVFAQAHLSPSGRLSVILPSDCETLLRRTAVSFSLYPFRIVRIRTTARKPVSRIIAEFCRKVNPELVQEEILVSDNNYTDKFYL